MRRPRRNPDCALGRNHPDSGNGLHRHHPAAGVDELVFGMHVLWDDVAMTEFKRERGDGRGKPRAEMDRLSHSRHSLSQ